MSVAARKKRLPVLLLVLVAVACRAPALAGQETGTATDGGDIEKALAAALDKIERLRAGIEDHRDRIRVTRAEEESLLEELDKLDDKIAARRKKLAGLRARLAEQERLITAKVAELREVMAAKQADAERVRRRLLAFYRMGGNGFLDVIFSSSSLPDLLTAEEYYRAMVEHDQGLINGYREKIRALTRIRDQLQVEKDRLVRVIAGIKAQEDALARARAARMKLLDRIHTEKSLYQSALAEMEKAARRLRERISRLESRYRAKTAPDDGRRDTEKKRRPARGFAALKGRLEPPAAGVVTTRFGKNRRDRFGIATFASGIDIRTDEGATVRAVAPGRVVYAGTLRGYGRIVIIDHGRQYYTLVSRLGEIRRQEGDTVAAGDEIGVMDEQEGVFGQGLHFEIRHGTEPLDPMKWLRRGALAEEDVPGDD